MNIVIYNIEMFFLEMLMGFNAIELDFNGDL